MAEEKKEVLSAAKWANKLGLDVKEVRKVIRELGIKPDVVRGACSYYVKETAEKIKEIIKSGHN
jgi:iron uptake system EfeUOB component EfeO/EfeM